MSLILSGTDGLSDVDGTAATPAIRGTDANTGIFFPAADTIAFSEGGAEVARFDSSGNFGIGQTSPAFKLDVQVAVGGAIAVRPSTSTGNAKQSALRLYGSDSVTASRYAEVACFNDTAGSDTNALTFSTGYGATIYERGRFSSDGNLLVGKTSNSFSTAGMTFTPGGLSELVASSSTVIAVNRLATDGNLIDFYQAGTLEGAISVSGTTVTYGGGHLARFGQLPDGLEDPTLLKGTVLTNLDEMCVWINKETGIPADNEQCNKVKISDVDGDANVAGVFVSWSYDEQHDTKDLFVAMTGDMIIRIAQGITVARGDLLMSAGDGTAKPQGDDIVRSKTVAKVTSTHVTCTYSDGSYCVPCVLMAC